MLYKKDIINFLFVASFPIYGLGNYISAAVSSSAGFLFSVSAHLLIILFYLIDILYKKEFHVRVNWIFFLMITLIISGIVSLIRSLLNELPEEVWYMTLSKSVMLMTPFPAFIIVVLYDRNKPEHLVNLTFASLSFLMLINLIGQWLSTLSH